MQIHGICPWGWLSGHNNPDRRRNASARTDENPLDFDAASKPTVRLVAEDRHMFRIGEFSQIARVSTRLLRYYDGIGLLRPVRHDPQTGYRYYSASQLADLNRILALKELGLTLDQVGRMLGDKISAQEIRGMLTLRKAELERSLAEEAARLRHVESRLLQIDEQGALKDYDVVIKSAAPRPFLALRATFPHLADVMATLRDVSRTVAARVPAPARDHLIVVAHSDFDDEDLDLEIGFGLTREVKRSVALPDRRELTARELPAVETLATVVRKGPLDQSHLAFGALGLWMEANGYGVAGPCREVFLDGVFASAEADAVMEIQFPVTKAA
jgi:DNA-binding transcriptional MerR regulator